ncbi:hypothetical protein BgiMline_033454, partial [Biomphalaria glabrata]
DLDNPTGRVSGSDPLHYVQLLLQGDPSTQAAGHDWHKENQSGRAGRRSGPSVQAKQCQDVWFNELTADDEFTLQETS